jgi:hypothetical protein
MEKALKIFIPTFIIILLLNQMAYGFCFKGYCIASALPKVTILAVIVSAFIYWVKKNEE